MINISAEDAKLFQDNGFTKEQIGATINHYREQGLSDDDIQLKINDRLSSFGKAPVEEKKGIDLTPSGVYKKAVAGAVAPLRAAIYKESIPEAYQTGMEKLEEFKPVGGIADLAFDTAVYSRLPMLKGASAAGKVGAFAGNAAIQGGVPGLLEGAKEGNALEGAGTGAGIATGVQSLPVIGKVAKPILQVAPKTANLLARSLGRIQPETLERAVQPDSKALDLTREQAQNLLMDTTERIQNTYNNMLSQRGEAVSDAVKNLRSLEDRVDVGTLQGDIERVFDQYGGDMINPARNLTGSLERDLNSLVKSGSIDLPPILNEKAIENIDPKMINSISPLDLQKVKEQIGKMINWADETAKGYKNPILEQLYGKYNARLNELSPELKQANEAFENLRAFQKNEGLRRILRPGDNIDTASSALRNYNSTVTKGNTNRNIQDLENLFIKEGAQPFLKDIDDVNAAMDLLNARSTGDSWLANLTTQLSRPALKGVRYLNQKGIPQAITNFSEKVSPEVRRILTPALVQLGIGD